MKKFLVKLTSFLILLFFFEKCITIFFDTESNKYQGNNGIEQKITYLKNKGISYHAYYIGSSKTFRQVNPLIIDSIVSSSTKQDFQSFNLGVPATFSPETDVFLGKLLEESFLLTKTKVIFFEISEMQRFGREFPDSEQDTYWINYKELSKVLSTILDDTYITYSIPQTLSNAKSIMDYVIGFILNQYNIGAYSNKIKQDSYPNNLGLTTRGYYPVESDLINTPDLFYRKELSKRRNELVDNPNQLVQMKNKMSKVYAGKNHVNQFYSAQLKELINKCKEKGILLIPLLPPRSANQYTVGLIKSDFATPVFDLGNPLEFPELYALSNAFDKGHLNQKGALLYSQLIGFRLAELLQDKQ